MEAPPNSGTLGTFRFDYEYEIEYEYYGVPSPQKSKLSGNIQLYRSTSDFTNVNIDLRVNQLPTLQHNVRQQESTFNFKMCPSVHV